MRVLVVDDTQSVRERLAAMIAAIAGVERVTQEADGLAGLAAIAMEAPDVVVLDIRMPRVNGFQLLAELNGRAESPTCIVVSNHAEYTRHALLAGASYFFDKSTEIDALLATIGALALRRRAS
ncbi:MAG: response regulator transcription factor [bacterium]